MEIREQRMGERDAADKLFICSATRLLSYGQRSALNEVWGLSLPPLKVSPADVTKSKSHSTIIPR